jgi:hypothetical protein
LVTLMSVSTSLKATVSVAVGLSVLPSSSVAVAVTVLEWSGPPKSPATVALNLQV